MSEVGSSGRIIGIFGWTLRLNWWCWQCGCVLCSTLSQLRRWSLELNSLHLFWLWLHLMEAIRRRIWLYCGLQSFHHRASEFRYDSFSGHSDIHSNGVNGWSKHGRWHETTINSASIIVLGTGDHWSEFYCLGFTPWMTKIGIAWVPSFWMAVMRWIHVYSGERSTT